jgi:hypothetical protein
VLVRGSKGGLTRKKKRKESRKGEELGPPKKIDAYLPTRWTTLLAIFIMPSGTRHNDANFISN